MACPVNHCVSDDEGCSSNDYEYSSDEVDSAKQYKNVISRIFYKLENLNFAFNDYEQENNNVIRVDIMKFNPTKLTVERNGDITWKVLYDNKTLILNLKSFSGVICRSKRLPRQKYVRIDDLCLKKIYREICHLICHLINAKEYHDWYNEYCKIFLNYLDHRLSMNKIHYFEDVSIVLEGAVLLNKGEGKHSKLRLKNEMISSKSMSF